MAKEVKKKTTLRVKSICVFWVAVCVLFLYSCERPLHKNTFVIAGTYVEVISPDPRAAGIVHQEFKRLDKVFNSYDPDSEISRLNNTYNVPFKVSGDIIRALELSREVEVLTKGAFDVSYGVLYGFWKDLIKRGNIQSLPKAKQIKQLKKLCGSKYIEINSKKSTVLIRKKGLKIDLGGIAKGYIVDKAVSKLKENGINSALINAGGDIYCLGKNKGRPWTLGLRDPEDAAAIIKKEDLVDLAIATSGDYEQFFEYEGRRFSHLIDPRRGYPVESNIVSVSVIGENCVIADSLATAFFIMGSEAAKDFLSEGYYAVTVFVVTKDKDGKHIEVLN